MKKEEENKKGDWAETPRRGAGRREDEEMIPVEHTTPGVSKRSLSAHQSGATPQLEKKPTATTTEKPMASASWNQGVHMQQLMETLEGCLDPEEVVIKKLGEQVDKVEENREKLRDDLRAVRN
eukprot:TRINITY_DN20493_c0_g2_i1.p1 TRINITY_DN20493_c0_g2~~TRINITY_DN20493_c0_g2_i1.p1  ORF type:complete len:123 (+),score=31.28 TRINITY_DN20493_c0_g2_i1:228-596(+)